LFCCFIKSIVGIHHTECIWVRVAGALQQPMRNPPIEIDAAEKYPKYKNKKTKKKTKHNI